MRIAFMGKGGSGKTTIAASLITYLQEYKRVKHILAIDADMNMHLQGALGMTGERIEIGDRYNDIIKYLKGKRKDIDNIANASILGTVPPSLDSNFIRPVKEDPFLSMFAQQSNGISLLTVGDYTDEDVGTSCYHGKLNSLEIIYHHLLDTKDEYVVIDSVAGIDNIATSVFWAPDITLFVIEPTLKSIQVFNDYLRIIDGYKKEFNLQVFAIVNKASKGDMDFILKHLDKEMICTTFPESVDVKRFEQGDRSAFNKFVRDNKDSFDTILNKASKINRDWNRYYDALLKTYKKECITWANESNHMRLDTVKDPNFSYQRVIK